MSYPLLSHNQTLSVRVYEAYVHWLTLYSSIHLKDIQHLGGNYIASQNCDGGLIYYHGGLKDGKTIHNVGATFPPHNLFERVWRWAECRIICRHRSQIADLIRSTCPVYIPHNLTEAIELYRQLLETSSFAECFDRRMPYHAYGFSWELFCGVRPDLDLYQKSLEAAA